MDFKAPLVRATLLRRYKRFLADVEFEDGTQTTVHCPNPGAMLGVAPPGAPCWVSRAENPARKLAWTLEIVECPGPEGQTLVGINTHHPNRLAEEAIAAELIPSVPGDVPRRREVKYGAERSRIDLVVEGTPPVWVEVKNCHLLRRADGVAEFPDCVTTRGLKHLRELMGVVEAGDRAVLLFIVQRSDARGVASAADLDPAYAKGLQEAAAAGVEILAYGCHVSPTSICVQINLPIEL